MSTLDTSMPAKQQVILFLFTPIALLIAVTAATMGWKPAFNPTSKKGFFIHEGKEYLQMLGSCWELPNH